MVAHYTHNNNNMNSNLLIPQQAISAAYNYNKLYYIIAINYFYKLKLLKAYIFARHANRYVGAIAVHHSKYTISVVLRSGSKFIYRPLLVLYIY